MHVTSRAELTVQLTEAEFKIVGKTLVGMKLTPAERLEAAELNLRMLAQLRKYHTDKLAMLSTAETHATTAVQEAALNEGEAS